MKSIFQIKILIILLLVSCNNNWVDCNSDLVYQDGLTYHNGNLYTGECMSFYTNGNKMNHQKYLNGMDHGNWTFYFKNGKVETEANFLNNKREGKWIYYFDDGKTIRQISFYKAGLKDSIWIKFSGDNKIEWKKEFKKDTLVKIY